MAGRSQLKWIRNREHGGSHGGHCREFRPRVGTTRGLKLVPARIPVGRFLLSPSPSRLSTSSFLCPSLRCARGRPFTFETYRLIWK